MRKVLIVEDEAVIAEDLSEAIEEWGWSVVGPVRDPEKALELADSHRLAAAIVDIRLRSRDTAGIDIGAALQGERGIPVIYLSGSTNDELSYTVKAVQPFAFIEKPVEAHYLHRVLMRALRA